MTTPTGQISFSQIAAEFGYPTNKNIGAYRVDQTIGDRNWTLDTGVPTSGTIKFSDLRGKTCNVVVDYPQVVGENYESNVYATTKYTSNGVVVGGFKSIPPISSTTETKKVYHLIRKTIGGSSADGVALRTGTWNSSAVTLNFIITSSGEIIGKGGTGGEYGGAGGYGSGYNSAQARQTGGDGSPAFYSTYPCSIVIESSGRIQAGGGGGGGAGSGCCDPDSNPQDPVANGGGGGGGAGLPAGNGGATSPSSGGITRSPTPGGNGSKYAGGNGGRGASTRGTQSPRDCAYGGGGGGGGGPTSGQGGDGANGRCDAQDGQDGSSISGGRGGDGRACVRNYGYRAGGPGGANGKAVLYNSGVTINVTINSGGVYFGGSGQGAI